MFRAVLMLRRSVREAAPARAGAALLLAAGLWVSCGEGPRSGELATSDPIAAALEAGFQVDTVGVRNLAEGDTLNLFRGLTIIETTKTFPPDTREAEAFAWEFYAEALRPVKLIVVRYARDEKSFELVGESPIVLPERLGINRIALPEPIPVSAGDKFGIYQPEEGTIPFRKIRNWKTMIAAGSFERPFTSRDRFATYGWRYAVRVYYRHRPGEGGAR